MKCTFVGLLFLAACQSEPEPQLTCRIDELPTKSLDCNTAQKFAARDSLTIRPTQADVDIYFDRWLRAIAMEPILIGRGPQSYRNRQWQGLNVYTSNPAVISAWSSRQLETSVAEVDETVNQLFEPRLADYYRKIDGSETYYFGLYVGGIYNEDLVHRGLQAGGAWLDEPVRHSGDDGVWAWTGEEGSIAQIDMTFGWGDCFVQCSGYRTLRAIVPPVGDAQVFDAGGDPLPDYIQLSPSTTPL